MEAGGNRVDDFATEPFEPFVVDTSRDEGLLTSPPLREAPCTKEGPGVSATQREKVRKAIFEALRKAEETQANDGDLGAAPLSDAVSLAANIEEALNSQLNELQGEKEYKRQTNPHCSQIEPSQLVVHVNYKTESFVQSPLFVCYVCSSFFIQNSK